METSNFQDLMNTLHNIIEEENVNNEENIEDVEYEEVTEEESETETVAANRTDPIRELNSELEFLLRESLGSDVPSAPSEVSDDDDVVEPEVPPINPLGGTISSTNIPVNEITSSESALDLTINAEAEARSFQDSLSELMSELIVPEEDSVEENVGDDYIDTLLKGTEESELISLREENRYNNIDRIIDSMRDKTILTSRFSGLSWAKNAPLYPVTLIGQGGIGSFVNLFLSRIRPKYLYLYDDDIYEYENLSGQLITNNLLGEAKVKGAGHMGDLFSNYHDYILCKGKFTTNGILTPITITGLDNMTGRKEAYYTWKERFKDNPAAIFIDGRLTVENFQIFSLKGGGADTENMKDYEENHLFGEGEAIANVCSMKQTSHIAGMIGSYITNIYTNFINNLDSSSFPLYVPYYVEYNANMFNLEVKGDYI